MNDAMIGLLDEIELRMRHLRTLATLQASTMEQNAALMREAARLRAENRHLREEYAGLERIVARCSHFRVEAHA